MPRIEVNPDLVFVLAYRQPVIDEEIRVGPVHLAEERRFLFTVIPAPRHEEDDRRYLAPYFLRGWSVVPFLDPDDPRRPEALRNHADPYLLFCSACQRLSAEERRLISPLDFRYAADPLG